jgi:predicted RNase H-like nuclease (RuvC/YqgF family)
VTRTFAEQAAKLSEDLRRLAARLQAVEDGEAMYTHEDVTALIEKRIGRERRRTRELEAQLYEAEAERDELEGELEALRGTGPGTPACNDLDGA